MKPEDRVARVVWPIDRVPVVPPPPPKPARLPALIALAEFNCASQALVILPAGEGAPMIILDGDIIRKGGRPIIRLDYKALTALAAVDAERIGDLATHY